MKILTSSSTRTKIILAFAAVYIIWGSTYLAVKVGIKDIPPFTMASMRYLTAGLLLIFSQFVRKGRLPLGTIGSNLALGVFMMTLGQGVLFWTSQYLPSGLTAVFIATLPVCYIVVDKRNWSGYLGSKLTLFSIVLSLVGVSLLFWGQAEHQDIEFGEMSVIASFVVIGSCLCWATGSIYYKYNLSRGAHFYDTGWQLVGGGISCLAVAVCSRETTGFEIAQIPLSAWGAVLYLAVAGSIVALTSSYYLLDHKPAAVVGTYAYVNPVIAVLLGYVVLGETIIAIEIAGMLIILIAAYLANRVKLKTAHPGRG